MSLCRLCEPGLIKFILNNQVYLTVNRTKSAPTHFIKTAMSFVMENLSAVELRKTDANISVNSPVDKEK